MGAFIALIIVSLLGACMAFGFGEIGNGLAALGAAGAAVAFLLSEARRERKMDREIDEKIAREREARRCH